jgi:hypothetical protein
MCDDMKPVAVKLNPRDLMLLLDALSTLDEYAKTTEQADMNDLKVRLSMAFVTAVRINRETFSP